MLLAFAPIVDCPLDVLSEVSEKVTQLLPSAHNRPSYVRYSDGFSALDVSLLENQDWGQEAIRKDEQQKQLFSAMATPIFEQMFERIRPLLRQDGEVRTYIASDQARVVRLTENLQALSALKANTLSALQLKFGNCGHFAVVSGSLLALKDRNLQVETHEVEIEGYGPHTFTKVGTRILDVWSKQADEGSIYDEENLPPLMRGAHWKTTNIMKFSTEAFIESDYPTPLKRFFEEEFERFLSDVAKQI